MPRKVLAQFEVDYLQILDENGTVDTALLPPLTKEQIITMYRTMVIARVLDNRMLALQRSGRIGTFAMCTGQEAVSTASVFALETKDWFVPAFRETPGFIMRGIPMRDIILFYGGDERGHHIPMGNNTLPVSIPVGTQTLHATGIAWGIQKRKEHAAAICFFGDGGTSEGDFHEALNFAGVFKVPVVFICQNNQWAISLARERQTAAKTLAQKAIAYGFEGIQIDGNDLFSVYKAVKDALDKAKAGGGPTLIECYTFRLGDHTTSDDASRYRDPKLVEAWTKKDPILRTRNYITKQQWWNQKNEDDLLKEAEALADRAVAEFDAIEPPAIEDIFKYTFAEMPEQLKEQLESLKKSLEETPREYRQKE